MTKRNLKIYTNEVAGGWNPEDLLTFLGGSEECVVLLAEAFARAGFNVTVYHTKEKESDVDRAISGVNYRSRHEAESWMEDIFITFKDPRPFLQGADAAVKIHWSSDLENPWNTANVDAFVNLTTWHWARNAFVPASKSGIIPHGIDTESLDSNKDSKDPNTILYCSSPDRGLLELLNDWEKIQKNHDPGFKLIVAYGFNFFDRNKTPQGQQFKRAILEKMDQPGIEYVGAASKKEIEWLYHRCSHWILPLAFPDAELFCLNALKSYYCGCVPIVRKIGALQDTVGEYIDYEKFVQGSTSINYPLLKVEEPGPAQPIYTWDEIVKTFWLPMIEKIKEEKGMLEAGFVGNIVDSNQADLGGAVDSP